MNKKIGVLTIHYGVNYGSALQSYALNYFLNSKGIYTELINYIPDRYKLWNVFYKEKKSRYPLILIYAYFPIYVLKNLEPRYRFANFIKKNIKCSRKITNRKDLRDVCQKYDALIVGSDQVWNSDYNSDENSTYYFDFVDSGVRKIAYAASFGKDYIEEKEIKEIKENLKSFNCISVREWSAKEIIKKMGYDSAYVVDPTFLLPKEKWLEFACHSNIKLKSKYLLVYVMDGIYTDLINNAEKICKKENLSLYVITFSKISDSRIDRQFLRATPADFVYLFANASFVVTNSFHGTAFSIIMKKRMLIIGKKKYNTRMESLLSKLNCKNRFIQQGSSVDDNMLGIILQSDDIDAYASSVEKWIKDSEQWISDSLEME